jgi:hypothetical protein
MSSDSKGLVINWLKKSGFPLEMRIAAEWEKADFAVSQGVYYIDPESDKARETDIIASKENVSSDAWLRFFCIVECKSSHDPRVMFPRRGLPLEPAARIRHLAVSRLSSPYLSRIARRSDIAALPIFAETRRPAYGMVRTNSEKQDDAYAAVMTVSKATSVVLGQVSSESEDSFELLWPLIVTEAPLFEAQLSATGDINVEQIERGTLVWRHPIARQGVAAIDVVRADAAATFIQQVKDAVELILWNTAAEASQALARRKELAAKVRQSPIQS